MPVTGVAVSEGPGHARNSQSRRDGRIFVNVSVVVVVNELMPEGLAENQPGDCH